ncbi:MAG: class I SAM-dependent methyltransferase [Actinomycetota bacterium]
MQPAARLLTFINNFFTHPEHPFDLQLQGKKTFAEWEYEQALKTFEGYFADLINLKVVLEKKVVLDVGCGSGGRTAYYAERGPVKVIGIDIFDPFVNEARQYIKQKNLESLVDIEKADAADMPFDDETFDTIIFNDVFEHLARPDVVLKECYRVLKSRGLVLINFPPYWHPYGAHVMDIIGIPWVHRFFSEKAIVQAYKHLVKGKPDEEKRLSLRLDDDRQSLSYLNQMTIKRFKRLIRLSPFKIVVFRLVPLKQFPLKQINLFPLAREYTTRMVVTILQK